MPKPDTDKERIICVPTIRDRLVQRAIGEYLTTNKTFPISNQSSFGFIRGRGPRDAIQRALEMRGRYDWCLKTDIQSFFDKIQRPYLKGKVSQALRGHSLEPLVLKVIDSEIRQTPENRGKLRKQGVIAGLGIRQGMPLSPLLANLALADFDKEVERRNIGMVRYADDLVLFFRSKDEAQEGRHYIKLLLQTVQLSIPEIEDGSKTQIVSRSDPLQFLGREIVFVGSQGAFVARVGNGQIKKIKDRLKKEFSFDARSSAGKNLQDTVVDLARSITAYMGIYKDAFNFSDFEGELRGAARAVVRAVFEDVFGHESLRSLTPKAQKFIGIELLEGLEANPELDV